MIISGERLAALRNELQVRKLDGFVIPLTDEHLSEFVGDYAQRLRWLTGFQGSAGWGAVLSTRAAIFVDGRYTLQVREQVDSGAWSFETLPNSSVAGWLSAHADKGWRIGYDPWLHTWACVTTTKECLARTGVELVAVSSNPIDALWRNQPDASKAKMTVYPEQFAGRSSAGKRRDIGDWLAGLNADGLVLSSLDSIAWVFNVRGSDIAHTPVVLAYALVGRDGSADLFVESQKITEEVLTHLGSDVRLHPRSAFASHLRNLSTRIIAIDPERSVAAIVEAIEGGRAKVLQIRDPVVLRKAVKNDTEIAGHRRAQVYDGIALATFLHWFSIEAPKGIVTEMSAAAKARECREATGHLRDLSFDTISCAGPNGALPHYLVSKGTDRHIDVGSLYLIDSGGQYLEGTTDVTRTLAIGTPSPEMCDRFTRVLKGHIGLATAVFPTGTRGVQLDILARRHLWLVGLDYTTGTGHGVGSYLGVHEGPQRIAPAAAPTGDCNEPLVPGMILSNEPGYYKTGAYGIRIENIMLVANREAVGGEREMLGFETLTLAPIDRTLINAELLTHEERGWLDSYHAQVSAIIGPHLDGETKSWLIDATQPI
jgi:Xaa-Pro aminopeptidase